MFSQNSQTPDDESNKTLQNNPRRRRKKTFKNKNKRKGTKRKTINNKKQPGQLNFTTITMSSWAESFTHAATWQLKHQVAYWKSKATALEYENRILHDIIRKNCLNGTQPGRSIDNEDVESENSEESESSEEEEENNEEFEVSEEFIQFLMQNAKYKEDAKRERERLKAKQNEHNPIEEMEAMPSRSMENKEEVFKELYGENWQKIAAVETSIHSQFLNDCDQMKPEYWPNIPLNFNFS